MNLKRKSKKMIIRVYLTLNLLITLNSYAQEYDFICKKMVFNEKIGLYSYCKNINDYLECWQNHDTLYNCRKLNKGEVYLLSDSNHVEFIEVKSTGGVYPNKGQFNKHDYYYDNIYLLAVIKTHGSLRFYRLKGFLDNDFELFINDLCMLIPYSKKEIKKNHYLIERFWVESLDFECLRDSYLKKKNRKCDYSNIERNIKLIDNIGVQPQTARSIPTKK